MNINLIKNSILKYNNFFDTHFKEKKNLLWKLSYFLDLVIAYIIHGSTVTDYFEYEYYKKRYYERKSFVTFKRAKKYWEVLHKQEYIDELYDKLKIYKNFNKYLGREYIYITETSFEEFSSLCKKNNELIAKPYKSSCGIGVKKIIIEEYGDLKELYKELKNEDIILEEYIDQLKEVAEFHPSSVNTIRVTTVFKDSKVHIMNAAFRMGNNFANIDNHAAGGIVAAIDKETGVVSSSGIDKYSNRYLYHPVTNKQIIGYSIPFWEEIINLAKELATVIPEIGYVGWDIALTESGPLLIEGNYRGMFDVQQQADQIGKRSTYDEIVLGLNK